MRKIRAKDTKPELIVRKLLHTHGYRYRLHRKDLPGQPDIVFPPRQKVIQVYGCFWHQHPKSACKDGRRPKSNEAYWEPKFLRNIERDRERLAELKQLGWKPLIIWECEIKDTEKLLRRIRKFLD